MKICIRSLKHNGQRNILSLHVKKRILCHNKQHKNVLLHVNIGQFNFQASKLHYITLLVTIVKKIIRIIIFSFLFVCMGGSKLSDKPAKVWRIKKHFLNISEVLFSSYIEVLTENIKITKITSGQVSTTKGFFLFLQFI